MGAVTLVSERLQGCLVATVQGSTLLFFCVLELTALLVNIICCDRVVTAPVFTFCPYLFIAERAVKASVTALEEVPSVRTRGDGGSIDVNESSISADNLDDLCVSQQLDSMSMNVKKNVLSRSSSVQLYGDRVNETDKYGSLDRARKAKRSHLATTSLQQSRSECDVLSDTRNAARPDNSVTLREYIARRNLDAIKDTLSNMTASTSPHTVTERLFRAVPPRGEQLLEATQQDSMMDASVEVVMLRKQKELIKQRASAKPVNGAGRNVQNSGLTHLLDNSTNGSKQVLEPRQCYNDTNSQISKKFAQTSSYYHTDGDERAWSHGLAMAANAKPNLLLNDQMIEALTAEPASDLVLLDDTVRLEPSFSPSVTLDSTFTDLQQPDDQPPQRVMEQAPGNVTSIEDAGSSRIVRTLRRRQAM